VGSRCSSETCSRPSRSRRVAFGLLACLALGGSLGACVTVRPEEREILADPAMTFGAGGDAAAHEDHVLSNREGSIGGGASSGGGCGCN
jgi:hypothetical protein